MSENRCVCCGEIIPEGRQICIICENNALLEGLKWGGKDANSGANQDIH